MDVEEAEAVGGEESATPLSRELLCECESECECECVCECECERELDSRGGVSGADMSHLVSLIDECALTPAVADLHLLYPVEGNEARDLSNDLNGVV